MNKLMDIDIQKFSGGSYNYNFETIDRYYSGCMFDLELDELMNDLVKVCHDLEWWQDNDISESEYRETVHNFKNKWFGQSRDDRLEKIINERINRFKNDLIKSINN